ncbi:MAG: 30S ribosomal protein S16 [Planctomycetes bacterium]|nr:30S ribosomal protein S16 [Planctomycetota bacterium]
MAVRLRMKKMGRKHRPFFRVVAVDQRAPRDGKVIEYLGHYDPMLKETDARASLNSERIDYWLSVGAQPSDKVGVLIKKYGSSGTHLEQQRDAAARMQANKPTAPPAVAIPKPKVEEPAAEAPATEAVAEEKPAAEATAEVTEEVAAEPAAEAASEETAAPEAAAEPAEATEPVAEETPAAEEKTE